MCGGLDATIPTPTIHWSAGSANTTSLTSGTVDTSYAKSLAVCVATANGTANAFSDAYANSWTLAATSTSAGGFGTVIRLFVVNNPITGTADTFSLASVAGSYPSMVGVGLKATAVVGASGTPVTTQDPTIPATGTTWAIGSVTPSSTRDAMWGCIGFNNAVTSITIGSSYNITDSITNDGNHFAMSGAYKLSPSGAQNPSFSWTTADDPGAVHIAFKAQNEARTLAYSGVGGISAGGGSGGGGGGNGAPVSAALCAGSGPACAMTWASTSNLAVACGANFAGETVASISNTKGFTWTQVVANQHKATPGADEHCWTAPITSTGSDTVTISNQFGDAGFGATAEISGITSSFLDVNNTGGGTSGALSSGSFTTTAKSFIIGFGADGTASTPTVGSGFTLMGAPACSCLSDARVLWEFKAGVAAGANTATSTSTSTSWIMQGFNLKES